MRQKRQISFFKLIISPDPISEDKNQDLNMREITQATMLKIEEKAYPSASGPAKCSDKRGVG